MRDLMRQGVNGVGSRGLFGRQRLSLLTSAATTVGELKEVSGLEEEEPVAEAAVFPFGEVLFGDGTVIEVGGEDGFGLGEGVEPGEDEFGGDIVVELEVKFFADGVREASDFAEASSVHRIDD
jgi:hypothetical protein